MTDESMNASTERRVPTCIEPGCVWPAPFDGYCRRHWVLHFGNARDLAQPSPEPIERHLLPDVRGLSAARLAARKKSEREFQWSGAAMTVRQQ